MIDKNGYDELGRPCKDLNFMDLCFTINKRSIDSSSKHGCIVVHEDGTLLSAGYNNPVRGSIDSEIPMTRPDKYEFMEHSERNAVYNKTRHGGSGLIGSIFYITGFPCVDCLRAIIQVGAKKIIYGPLQCFNVEDFRIYKKLLENQDIIIERFLYDESLFIENANAKKLVDMKKQQGIPDIAFEHRLQDMKRF